MKKNQRFRGVLDIYLRWPIYLSALVILEVGLVAIYPANAIFMVAGFAVLYTIVAVAIYRVRKDELLDSVMDFATHYGQVQKEMLKNFEMPYAVLDETGHLIWNNDAFDAIFHVDGLFRWSIVNDAYGIKKEQLPGMLEPTEIKFTIDDRDLRVRLRRINLDYEENNLIDPDRFNGSVITALVYDDTEMNNVMRLNSEGSTVMGLIYLDNFEEALQGAEPTNAAIVTTLVDRRINRYFSIDHSGVVKKLGSDRYFIVMKKKALDEMVEDNFSVLDDVRKAASGFKITMTMSIGIGTHPGDIDQCNSNSKMAIDAALARGGDQVVVRNEERFIYYGGKHDQTETNVRVRAKRVAGYLKEYIENYEKVIVMGHSLADQDAFGSCVGIHAAARYLGKECRIVVNTITTSIRPMLNSFMSADDYKEGTIVNSDEAIDMMTDATLLVVVDTNKPELCECPQLLDMCRNILVIDHHRQGSEKIENTLYPYVEPNASSASEMISEILQYFDNEKLRIKNYEADCLYAGIMIDSGNFSTKTSGRTFEAAAYLRNNGADVTRIRKMFRDSMESYKARAEAVRSAELYKNEFAIGVCPAEGLESPTVVGAQAANELMNINLVRAAFVLTLYQDKVYISARSIDEINVQVIMERMGGGGHLNIAGVQLKGYTIDRARDELKMTLDSMLEKNEI
ncbi:MAG: DHH family phosphoesterase [Lachnospiraceae bacterium]|nr:DHH family phosphoesterase [Lachnospiraceae bacterium]